MEKFHDLPYEESLGVVISNPELKVENEELYKGGTINREYENVLRAKMETTEEVQIYDSSRQVSPALEELREIFRYRDFRQQTLQRFVQGAGLSGLGNAGAAWHAVIILKGQPLLRRPIDSPRRLAYH